MSLASAGEPRLVGAWRLQALDNADEGGRVGQADGLIMYDVGGTMSAQIISPASGGRAREHHAYFGTYSVDKAASTVTHHRVANTSVSAPADVVRQYDFESDDVLMLFPEGHPAVRLTFRRT